MNGQLAQSETAQLFRSVRAARPWVRARSARMETPPVAGCVLMKPGNDDPPVFMIPGASGSILQLAPIATAMTAPMSVYAIQPRGMAEGETPCRHIAEMAEYAIGVMRAVRNEGPYLLVGYSAGGLVALEMAQQLTASGHEVPLVVLLDTYPSREIWPLSCHLEILARQAVKALWTLRRCPLRQAADEVARRVRSLLLYLTASGLRLVEPPPLIAEGCDEASRRVHVATFNAGEAYRPSRYEGKVVYLQPEEIPNLEPKAPQRVWGKILPGLVIRRVPGSHLGLLDTGAAATAMEIGRDLAADSLTRKSAGRR
jgi:acetoacetyl-CoA synthetase